MISLFESDTTRQKTGTTSYGVKEHVKKSTDIACNFNSADPYNEIILPALIRVKDSYVSEHPALTKIPEWQVDQEYNIQRYKDGEGYFALHCEHSKFEPYRIMAWTLYLNDAESGTYYSEYDAIVEAQQGNLCIFPAFWTHMHCGVTPNIGTKYIATGWFSHLPA